MRSALSLPTAGSELLLGCGATMAQRFPPYSARRPPERERRGSGNVFVRMLTVAPRHDWGEGMTERGRQVSRERERERARERSASEPHAAWARIAQRARCLYCRGAGFSCSLSRPSRTGSCQKKFNSVLLSALLGRFSLSCLACCRARSPSDEQDCVFVNLAYPLFPFSLSHRPDARLL